MKAHCSPELVARGSAGRTNDSWDVAALLTVQSLDWKNDDGVVGGSHGGWLFKVRRVLCLQFV